jgi:hypothetical protein
LKQKICPSSGISSNSRGPMPKEEVNEVVKELSKDPSYGIVNLADISVDELLKEDEMLMAKYVGSWEAWAHRHGRIF